MKHLFPVPKPDSKRLITFANRDDYISFRLTSHSVIILAVGALYVMYKAETDLCLVIGNMLSVYLIFFHETHHDLTLTVLLVMKGIISTRNRAAPNPSTWRRLAPVSSCDSTRWRNGSSSHCCTVKIFLQVSHYNLAFLGTDQTRNRWPKWSAERVCATTVHQYR
jgi:hypothetical protein